MERSKESYKNINYDKKLELLNQFKEDGIITLEEYDKKIDSMLEDTNNSGQKLDGGYYSNQVHMYQNKIKQLYDSDNAVNLINTNNSNNAYNGIESVKKTSKNISLIDIGFYLGILSIFVGSQIGIIPLATIIIILIGRANDKKCSNKLNQRFNIGLILGVIFFISNLYFYGHI